MLGLLSSQIKNFSFPACAQKTHYLYITENYEIIDMKFLRFTYFQLMYIFRSHIQCQPALVSSHLHPVTLSQAKGLPLISKSRLPRIDQVESQRSGV